MLYQRRTRLRRTDLSDYLFFFPHNQQPDTEPIQECVGDDGDNHSSFQRVLNQNINTPPGPIIAGFSGQN